jgi:hypothetical protein
MVVIIRKNGAGEQTEIKKIISKNKWKTIETRFFVYRLINYLSAVKSIFISNHIFFKFFKESLV